MIGQLNLRNMKKMLKGDTRRDSKTWHWLGLARLCSDPFAQERNERESGALCHRHSNDMQDLPWKYKFILIHGKSSLLFSRLWLSSTRFSSSDRFSRCARDQTATSNPTLLQGEGKAQSRLVYSERERPRERIRTMIAVTRSPLLVHQHGDLSLLRKI